MVDEYQGEIKLKWAKGHEPPFDQKEEIERVVTIDIQESLGGLESPGELIFHTVFFGDIDNDPIVSVYGEKNDPEYFYCIYDEKAVWESFTDLETEEEVKKVLDFVNAKSVDKDHDNC